MGSKDPTNFVRYLTKLNLLPSPKRKALPGSLSTVGHYPEDSIDVLRFIDSKVKAGWSLQQVARVGAVDSSFHNDSATKKAFGFVRISNRVQGILMVGSACLLIGLGAVNQRITNSQGNGFSLNDLSSILIPTQSASINSLPAKSSYSDNQSVNLIVLNYPGSSGSNIAGATLTTTGNIASGRVVVPVSSFNGPGSAYLVGEGSSLSQLLSSGQVSVKGSSSAAVGEGKSGTATLKAQTDRISIITSSLTSSSKIFVTFSNDYGPATRFWVSNISPGASFTLQLDNAPALDSTFNWWIVN